MRAATRMAVKRAMDISAALLGLLLFGWLIVLAVAAATVDTGECGLFSQLRVGRHGRFFRLFKVRTMRTDPSVTTTATSVLDTRITKLGRLLRRTKIDELPQLINVLVGDMSLVGPRPDVPGFADALEGDDRVVLSVRPGITGPATLAFRNEEKLLAEQEDPDSHNRDVIYPEKVRLNRQYVENLSIFGDLKYLLKTLMWR